MKPQQKLFFVVFAIVIVLFALFEYAILPTDLIPNTPAGTYAIDLVSIVTAVGGCFALLYCFRFGAVKGFVERGGQQALAKVHTLRLVAWLVLMCVNVVFYYEARFATNAQYGILILLVAGVFCWPAEAPILSQDKKKDSED